MIWSMPPQKVTASRETLVAANRLVSSADFPWNHGGGAPDPAVEYYIGTDEEQAAAEIGRLVVAHATIDEDGRAMNQGTAFFGVFAPSSRRAGLNELGHNWLAASHAFAERMAISNLMHPDIRAWSEKLSLESIPRHFRREYAHERLTHLASLAREVEAFRAIQEADKQKILTGLNNGAAWLTDYTAQLE